MSLDRLAASLCKQLSDQLVAEDFALYAGLQRRGFDVSVVRMPLERLIGWMMFAHDALGWSFESENFVVLVE